MHQSSARIPGRPIRKVRADERPSPREVDPASPSWVASKSSPTRLSDAELLLLLVGAPAATPEAADARVLWAEHWLEQLGGLGALWSLEPAELGDGMAAKQRRRLLAAIELARRCLLTLPSRARLASHRDVLDWALGRLVPLEHEELWLLSLDARNCLKRADRVAQGGLHGCAVTPRDVLRPAVRNGASAVVVVHNHPSGDPTPSHDDLVMTRHLAEACDVVGIPLLDHVVVARGGSCSVAELGVLDLESACDIDLQTRS